LADLVGTFYRARSADQREAAVAEACRAGADDGSGLSETLGETVTGSHELLRNEKTTR
jgi:hypothetical protein